MDPYLKSVIEVNPEALEIAACLDDERRRGTVRGVLHGVPVLVKDVSDEREILAIGLTL